MEPAMHSKMITNVAPPMQMVDTHDKEWKYIAIGFFALLTFSIAIQIYANVLQIKKHKKEINNDK